MYVAANIVQNIHRRTRIAPSVCVYSLASCTPFELAPDDFCFCTRRSAYLYPVLFLVPAVVIVLVPLFIPSFLSFVIRDDLSRKLACWGFVLYFAFFLWRVQHHIINYTTWPIFLLSLFFPTKKQEADVGYLIKL